MKKEIHIRRSIIKGIKDTQADALIFMVVFVGILVAWIRLEDVFSESFLATLEAWAPAIALAAAAIAAIGAEFIKSRTLGADEVMTVEITRDDMSLSLEKKQWKFAFSEIDKVILDRGNARSYDNGEYALSIKVKGMRKLTFMTSMQELVNHKKFEKTELCLIYDECMKRKLDVRIK